jgi:hypothetical protein
MIIWLGIKGYVVVVVVDNDHMTDKLLLFIKEH